MVREVLTLVGVGESVGVGVGGAVGVGEDVGSGIGVAVDVGFAEVWVGLGAGVVGVRVGPAVGELGAAVKEGGVVAVGESEGIGVEVGVSY